MPEKKQPRFFFGYVVVAAGAVIMTVAWGTNRSFGVFLEPMLKEFGWTRAAISGSFTLNVLFTGVLAIFFGRLAERFGPRSVVTLCGLSLGVAYILTARLQSLTQFYLFYGILGGIGMSGMIVPMMSLVVKWFVKRRALMSGILVAGPGFGIIVFPLISSRLISLWGWRVSYLILGLIVFGVILGAAFYLRREPGELGLLPYGAEERRGENTGGQISEFSFGEAFRSRQFWMMNVVVFCDHFLVNTMVVHIVIHARDLGIAATSAASILSIAAGISIPGRVLMGWIGDRLGNRSSLLICFTIGCLAFLVLLWASRLQSLYLFAVLYGIGFWTTSGLISPMMAELFGLRAHATLYGFSIFIGSLGSAIGPVMAGYLFDVMGSYRFSFLICFALSCTSLLAVFLIRPLQKQSIIH